MSDGPASERGATRLERSLLALPELGLRVGWLREQLRSAELDGVAQALDRLTLRAHLGEARAREVFLPVALLLAQDRETDHVRALRQVSEGAPLRNLSRLLRGGPAVPAEPELDAPVPRYLTGRELTLGERRSLARRPTRLLLDKLLLDPDPIVLGHLLSSAHVTEDDVVRLAARRPLRGATLDALVRSLRWMARQRVRLTLIMNPGSPPSVTGPLLGTCAREELTLVVQNTSVEMTLRHVALELLERSPPFARRAHLEIQ